MDKKTAIIVGVIILVLTSIVTPFVLRKITDKTNDISQGMQVGETNKQNESGEIQEDKVFSGERISNEEIQESGDESEEQKPTEISGEQKKEEQESGESTTEYKSTSSQGATNQTTQSTEEKNNVPTNVDEENVTKEEQHIEIIEVVQNNTINQEETLPEQEVKEEIVQNNVVPDGAVGVLKIDKINLYQKVAEGHSLEVLKTDLGHVDETAYYKGNIGILGHNNGNAGYFKRLTELAIDDEIQYITKDGTMRYKVSEITEIEDTDWSKLSKTEDNRITLITCVRNVPNKRYCVQAVEI
ncbi:MAG: sortase [Clostridia bacterium]|nr:sortase [Clostridia bacterium]